MANGTAISTNGDGELLKIDELAARMKVHVDSVRLLWRTGQIPGMKLGHRTLRFHWPSVVAVLERKAEPVRPGQHA